ncbi:peptidyl-prolyl cis-trans isomerase [Emticicia aquatilis]|uniref:peptidylprolyl isomerase n=1 Tax=Emticicia aquatilis TaxID=1537369 RepID=A0A916Z687_9BACT|nr:peptidylprolyl isomerase [Emticicia aquatilis]GGD78505.1 peptidyl-prolyl cis-trans isomerase [Emticicia aquatilis]
MKKHFFVYTLLLISTISFAQKKSKKDYLVTLNTKYGTMHLVLFDDAPLHKANFVKLVEQKFYDSLLFHRIIDGFMIQGGDPESKTTKPNQRLGGGGGNMERIPFEFKPNHIHRKGALAAARDNNPEKKSSACQFYIVQGKKRTDEEVTAAAQRNGMNYTTQQRADYMILGGAPHLDNGYTVFGEAIDNLDLIDIIAKQPKDTADRPKEDIKMSMTVKKMRKKKITKKFGYKY